jgi:DhnA family fructose-bisphosphate aldolase class Ia
MPARLLDWIDAHTGDSVLVAMGHRIAHGGPIEKLADHPNYIRTHGEDMPEARNGTWGTREY